MMTRLRDWFALLRFRIVARRLPRTGPYAPGVISDNTWDYTLDAHVSPQMLRDRSETDPRLELRVPRPYGPDEDGIYRHGIARRSFFRPEATGVIRRRLASATTHLGFKWESDGVHVGEPDD